MGEFYGGEWRPLFLPRRSPLALGVGGWRPGGGVGGQRENVGCILEAMNCRREWTELNGEPMGVDNLSERGVPWKVEGSSTLTALPTSPTTSGPIANRPASQHTAEVE